MSLAVFDINDCGLGHGGTSSDWAESPGFALLKNDTIITGTDARAAARVDPQNSFSQYWQNLNQAPLTSNSKLVRHNADLAYAQLLQLHQNSNQPDEVLFAVPSTIDSQQLSLLLGLAQASPFTAVGLVDSAVASMSQQVLRGNTLFFDLQLHQLVCTQLRVTESDNGYEVARHGVDTFNDLGLKNLMDRWAHFIANEFIHQYRYDPFHSAQGEQQLYDNLPTWIHNLQGQTKTKIELKTTKGIFQLSLSGEDLLAASYVELQRAVQSLQTLNTDFPNIVLSHRVAQLPKLDKIFHADVSIVPKLSLLEGCLANLDVLCNNTTSLNYVTRLPARNVAIAAQAETNIVTPANANATPIQQPSHALYKSSATPIGAQLGFMLNEHGVNICGGEVHSADLVIIKDDSGLHCQINNGKQATISVPATLRLGSVIRWQDEVIELINVTDH